MVMGIFEDRKLNKQKQQAAAILNNFCLESTIIRNGMPVTREIGVHNIEYCFFPEIWDLMNEPQKMAAICKFTEKHSPDLPLSLAGFINSEEIDPDGNFVMIDFESKKVLIDFKTVLASDANRILIELLSYRDMMKENIFLDNISTLNLAQYANLYQLRHLLDGHENMILLAKNPNLKEEDYTYDMLKVCDLQSTYTQMLLRSTLKAIKIYEKVDFFTHDFVDFTEKLKQDLEDKLKPFKDATKKYVGDQNDVYEAIICGIYKLHELEKKGVKYEEFKNRSLSLPKLSLDEELFPNVTLSFERKDNLEK